jgi:hypothetical protein
VPPVGSIPRTCYGKHAILVDGSWWLLVSPIGSLGVVGIVGARCCRINTTVPPVMVKSSSVASNSITIGADVQYESIRPIIREAGETKLVADPLGAHLVDDGSLGAYVGETRMLAKAPKRTKGRK